MVIKATKIILVNQRNKEVLLYLRDNKPSIPHPGYWDLFGGSIEEGESPLESIKREVKEEIGI
ncbi:MAG: NUDIX domain-containing protein, partial [Nanoarchaeota archaeon]|nr:NUDIX domain-containing protein [Nanoarchaeota archaeon]